jgi:hypothetical protein
MFLQLFCWSFSDAESLRLHISLEESDSVLILRLFGVACLYPYVQLIRRTLFALCLVINGGTLC